MLVGSAAAALALLAPAADAATITPNILTDDFNSANADCSLREAVSIANADVNTAEPDCPITGTLSANGADAISLGAGTYSLTIAGAGENANATGDLDTSPSGLGDLTIDGQGQAATTISQDAAPDDRVLNARGATLTVQDLTVTGGTASGADPAGRGGGIHRESSVTLNLTNAKVSGNTASTLGGGIGTFAGGPVTLNASEVSGNTAMGAGGGGIYSQGDLNVTQGSLIQNNTATIGDGGGISIVNQSLTIADSTIDDNHAPNSFGEGGGIYVTNGLVPPTQTITGSRIINNDSGSNTGGGGIYSNQGPGTNGLDISDSLIEDNSVSSNAGCCPQGGGIIVTAGDLSLDSTIVRSNDVSYAGVGGGASGGGVQVAGGGVFTATDTLISENTLTTLDATGFAAGAGIRNIDSTAVLKRTTVSGNTISGTGAMDGAGIETTINGPALTLVNSTVSDNTSSSTGATPERGGGIFAWNGTVDVISSTIAGNVAGDAGGTGDAIFETSNTTINVRNSIVAAADGPETCAGDIASGGRNVTTDPACFVAAGTGDAQGTDPQLAALSGLDSPLIGPAGFNSPLLTQAPTSISPAIDRVPAASCTDELAAPLTVDQRGSTRPLPSTLGGVPACESGAVERAPVVPTGGAFTPPGLPTTPTPPVTKAKKCKKKSKKRPAASAAKKCKKKRKKK